MLIIQADSIVLSDGKLSGPTFVLIKNGFITDIIPKSKNLPSVIIKNTENILHTNLLTPGFVDIHSHGLGGAEDVVNYWKNPSFTQTRLPKTGTTSFLASIVFVGDIYDKYKYTEMAKHMSSKNKFKFGAVMEGIHAEGPFVTNPGCLPEVKEKINPLQFQTLIDSIPNLKIMTISPSKDAKDGYVRIKSLLAAGVVPSLGHDKEATEDDILGALALSPNKAMHITHCFNVSKFHHRDVGLVNFGLLNKLPILPKYNQTGLLPCPSIEIIADLAHVHPVALQLAINTKDPTQIACITDSISEPKPGKIIRYAGNEMKVSNDGKVAQVGNVLAGSCSTILDQFRSLINIFGVSIGKAIFMCSTNPAKIVGLDKIGTIDIGKRADLLFWRKINSKDKFPFVLERTIIHGETIFQKKQSAL